MTCNHSGRLLLALWLVATLLVLWLLASSCSAADLWQWTQPAEHHQACVIVRADGAGGTGALIYHENGRGYVLTAAHVVEHTSSASATWWATGYRSAGRIVARDPGNDLAIFEVEPPAGAPILPIAAQMPPAGSACELLGFGGPSDRLRHFSGVASRSNDGTLELTANLLNGDSGGPVVYSGELVGVIRGGPNQANAGIVDDHGHAWPVVHPAWTTPPGPMQRLWQRVCPGGYCGPSRPSSPATTPPLTAPPTAPPLAPPIAGPPSTPPLTPVPPPATPPAQPPAAMPDVGEIADLVVERMAADPRFRVPPVTVNVDQVAAALVEHMPAPTIDVEQVADLVLAKMAADPRFQPTPSVTAEQLANELPPLRFRWTLPDGSQATASARLGQTVVLELPATP
jgi:hypothetical protein